MRKIMKMVLSPLDAAARAAWMEAARRLALSDHAAGFDEAWRIVGNVPGWLNATDAATLWGVVAELRPSTAVEIGSYLGRSTSLLALAARRFCSHEATVHAIDPHTGDRQQLEALGVETLPSLDLFRLHLRAADVDNIVIEHVEKSDIVARSWVAPIDLLYVDGWHSYEAVYADTVNFGSHLSSGGVVCFDDYGQYQDVRSAAEEACRELGLNWYGVTTLQAWAGKPDQRPRTLERVTRISQLPLALRRIRQWSR
jgi:predicted O-methyltransferase YrrM